jgi:Zn-dependent M16 (insulinase) family peptidase
MFEIIDELLSKFDFSDLERLKSLLLEYRAGLESMIVQNGHRLAMSLASRNFSQTCALSEEWHGIHQLQTIKRITDDLTDNTLQTVSKDLSLIGKTIFTPNNIKMALIGEDQAINTSFSATESILKNLQSLSGSFNQPHGFVSPKVDFSENEIPHEGWSTSSAVSFVARAFKTVRMEHEDAPSLSVIAKMLRSLYLHREIREKGGAYGGFAIYNLEDGLFLFGSYRDPHITSTLNVYDGASAYIRSGDYSDEDIKEAVLQVCSEIDKPDPPGVAARKAFYRQIVSLSDEMRNQFKKHLLTLTLDRVRNVAKRYFADGYEKQAVVVISNEDRLKAANKKLEENPLTLHRI